MLFKDIKQVKLIDVEHSSDYIPDINPYTETIQKCIHFNEDWFNLKTKMMKLEHSAIITEDTQLLSEGSKEFFKRIADFFRKIWDYIKGLWKKFVSFIDSMILNDKKFIKKYKDKIDNANLKDFSYTGHTYTISSNIPKVEPEMDFINTSLFGNGNSIDYVKLSTMSANLKASVNDNYHYDQIRGKILGKGAIDSEEFQNELFKTFRNEEDSTDEIAVTGTLVNLMVNTLESSKEDIKKCEDLRKNIDKFYDGVIKFLNDAVKLEKDNTITIKGYTQSEYSFKSSDETRTTYSSKKEGKTSSTLEELRSVASSKSEEAKRISNIYNMAFGAKLEAIKERRKEFRKVLNKVVTL